MDPVAGTARSLHEVFASLGGDPDAAATLAASGHGDLPPDLLTEAIANYADTAPPEVAEHLSPVVLGAGDDAGLGLELLSSAPQVTWDDVPDDGLAEPGDHLPDDAADDVPHHDLPDLDFGAGDMAHLALDHSLDSSALDDHVDDVAPPEHHVPVGDDDVALEEPADDLPHPDLADEGWDDAAWDGDEGHDDGDDGGDHDVMDA